MVSALRNKINKNYFIIFIYFILFWLSVAPQRGAQPDFSYVLWLHPPCVSSQLIWLMAAWYMPALR